MSSYSYTARRGRGSSFGGSRSGGRRFSKPKNKGNKQFIHPSKFVQVAKAATIEPYQPKHAFQDFDIEPLLKANIEKKGFVNPSPIQDQTIPVGLEGKDIIGIANTGTGKTAAFGIPVLHQLMIYPGSRALIMAPTRELAQQIEDELRSIAKGSKLMGALLIGGVPIGPQIRDLRAKPQIVIGTPGRMKDHLERGTLDFKDFTMVVLDEVDRMLDMGFINDIREILSLLPAERQSFFFSATLDGKVATLIDTFATDPVTVSVKSSTTSENVHQDVVHYDSKTEQIEKLHDILNKQDVEKIIVFDETQRSVERLSKELVERGFQADAIHGGKSQGQRQRALNKFKDNKVNILVATDVAARGIDVSDVTHVINYSVPQTYDDYVHRIGRAGRAGRIGQAYTFVSK
jgi:ATP-dependent RNA helicase RhlE